MNILQIVSNMDRNGPAYVVNDLAWGLTEMGHKVVVASSGGTLEKTFSNEVSVLHIPIGRVKGNFKLIKYLLNGLKSYIILSKCIKVNNINVVNAHQPVPIFLGLLIKIRHRKVFVTTSHNVYKKSFINKTYSLGDKVAAVSDKVRENTIQIFNVDPQSVITIPNGINPLHLNFDKDESAIPLHENKDHFIFGTIAGLRKQKSLDILIKAFANIYNELNNIELVICGDGAERESLINLTKELGIANRVKFVGFRNDIGYVLSNIDVFCLSSQYEGLPISMLEAMSLKIPVIATDVGGIPEVIEDGSNGILIRKNDINSFTDAMRRMYKCNDFRDKIAEEGYRTIETKFSYKIMSENYASLYTNLLNRGK